MKRDVGPAALVIQVKNKGMSLLQIKKIGLLGIYTLLVCMLFSCGSMRKSTTLSKEKAVAESFAGVILKMNDLEAQVKDALAENADKIAAAKQAIETVNI